MNRSAMRGGSPRFSLGVLLLSAAALPSSSLVLLVLGGQMPLAAATTLSTRDVCYDGCEAVHAACLGNWYARFLAQEVRWGGVMRQGPRAGW